jgi:uncharacterized protein
MTGRETAWRILANEFRAASEEERATGDRAASYVLSPLGARMNRVLTVGMLTPAEPTAGGESGGFWRARLTDPTGTIPVSAGSFQPRAQAELRAVTAPTRAMVMGKPNLFVGSSGTRVGTLRAESVRPISEEEYRLRLAEAATQTLDRMALVERLRASPGTPDEALWSEGLVPMWITGARATVARYTSWDPAPYREALDLVARTLRGHPSDLPATPTPAAARAQTEERSPEVRVSRAPSRPEPRPLSGEEQTAAGPVIELIDLLAEESPDGYADLTELADRAAREGISAERLEELLHRLDESGAVEEPIVGKFRRPEGPEPE